MAKVVVFNQKGGVGKTTTTLSLAALLARRGRPPLVLDLDPQAHLSSISGVTVEEGRNSLYAYYQDAKPLAELIRPGGAGWSIIPSHLDLSKVDSQFGKGPQALNKLNLGIVRENLNTERPILMDASPLLGVLSLNGIFACDRVLIPISADYLAINGALQVDRTLRALDPCGVLSSPALTRGARCRRTSSKNYANGSGQNCANREFRKMSAWPRARPRIATYSLTPRAAAARAITLPCWTNSRRSDSCLSPWAACPWWIPCRSVK
jgi:cellulose biosynthesis protein BcsQ